MNKKTFQCPEVRIISMTTESIIAASVAMHDEHADRAYNAPSVLSQAAVGSQW